MNQESPDIEWMKFQGAYATESHLDISFYENSPPEDAIDAIELELDTLRINIGPPLSITTRYSFKDLEDPDIDVPKRYEQTLLMEKRVSERIDLLTDLKQKYLRKFYSKA